jgi:hypothetical protein
MENFIKVSVFAFIAVCAQTKPLGTIAAHTGKNIGEIMAVCKIRISEFFYH